MHAQVRFPVSNGKYQILSKQSNCQFNPNLGGQSLLKENSHNSRTSDDIDMKLRPVTKLDKRKKNSVKKIGR